MESIVENASTMAIILSIFSPFPNTHGFLYRSRHYAVSYTHLVLQRSVEAEQLCHAVFVEMECRADTGGRTHRAFVDGRVSVAQTFQIAFQISVDGHQIVRPCTRLRGLAIGVEGDDGIQILGCVLFNGLLPVSYTHLPSAVRKLCAWQQTAAK